MKQTVLMIFFVLGAYSTALFSQTSAIYAPPTNYATPVKNYTTLPTHSNALYSMLYPPDLIMQHSSKIGLGNAQKEKMKAAIKEMEANSLDIKWDLRDEAEKLTTMVGDPGSDENTVIKQADRVMSLEKDMKLNQLSLLIKIKNILTAEQRQQLQQLRPIHFFSMTPAVNFNKPAVVAPGVRIDSSGVTAPGVRIDNSGVRIDNPNID